MIGLSFLQADYIRDDIKEVVLDTTTNLMWQDDATPASKTWLDAIAYCEALTLGSFSWRLPNLNELHTIADKTRSSPAINPVFTNVISNLYWSSTTTYKPDTSSARWINFDNGSGYTSVKTLTRYVRCVR